MATTIKLTGSGLTFDAETLADNKYMTFMDPKFLDSKTLLNTTQQTVTGIPSTARKIIVNLYAVELTGTTTGMELGFGSSTYTGDSTAFEGSYTAVNGASLTTTVQPAVGPLVLVPAGYLGSSRSWSGTVELNVYSNLERYWQYSFIMSQGYGSASTPHRTTFGSGLFYSGDNVTPVDQVTVGTIDGTTTFTLGAMYVQYM